MRKGHNAVDFCGSPAILFRAIVRKIIPPDFISAAVSAPAVTMIQAEAAGRAARHPDFP
jgi:hypothetical protein